MMRSASRQGIVRSVVIVLTCVSVGVVTAVNAIYDTDLSLISMLSIIVSAANARSIAKDSEFDSGNPTIGSREMLAPSAPNGPIIFQRGLQAAFDIPYNRGGQLIKIDPATGIETPFGAGSQPNFSPDGSQVVFLDSAHITKSPINTYTPTTLTILGGGSPITGLYPKWSPDAGAIAYNSTALLNGQHFYHTKIIGGSCSVCEISSSTQEFNPTGAISYLYPSWNPHPIAPATNQVVFVRTTAVTEDVNSGAFTGDIYTEEFTINPDGTITEGQSSPLTNSPAHYAFPVFSHDGTKLAFIKFDPDFASSLIVMDAHLGAAQTVLAHYAANSSGAAHHPAFSPDDSFIAFTDTNQIYKVPVASGTPVAVTTLENSDFDLWPTWAPGTLPARAVRAADASGSTGGEVIVPIELDAQGNETAAGYSVTFDPTKLSNPLVTLGSGSPSGTALITNINELASGHLGILLDGNGHTYAAGTRQMITVRFDIAANAALGTTPIGFGNSPIAESISDLNGATLSTTFTAGNVTIATGATPTPTPLPNADLHLRFNGAPPASEIVGQSVTYKLIVNNEGPSIAHGVYVQGPMPQGTLFGLNTSGFCNMNGGSFACILGDIDPGPPNATSGSSVRTMVLEFRTVSPMTIHFDPAAELDTTRNADNNTSNNAVSATTTVYPVPDLELIGIEVTQGIQDLQNSLPLVKGKPTFIRAHIKAGTPQSQGVKYKGTLTATDLSTNTILGTISNKNAGTTVTSTQVPNRALLDDSMYFEIPTGIYSGDPDWTSGNIQFEVKVDNVPLTCSEPDGSPNCKVSVNFQTANPFSIHFVLATYTDTAGISHTPNLVDILTVGGEILATYPMATFDFDVGTTNLAETACSNGNFSSMLREIQALRNQDIRNGVNVKTFYLGLLADQADCSGVSTNGMGYLGFNGGSNNVGPAAIAFVSRNGGPGIDRNSRVHELGHNLGFLHVNSDGSEASPDPDPIPTDGKISESKAAYAPGTAYGFDIFGSGNSRIYPSSTWDFMTYQRPRWVSTGHYTRFFNYVHPSSLAANSPQTVQTDKVAVVSGSVSASENTGSFGSIYVADAVDPVALAEPGEYAVRLEDGMGQALATYNVNVPAIASEIPNEPDLTGFSQVIAWNDNARRIVLLHNGQSLATREASVTAPAVTVTTPNGGETLSGTATLSWSASDADGDALKSAIDYSSDNGATWKTLAVDVDANSYQVDTLGLVGSTQALFRVTVTDGFYSAQDQSDAVFTTPSHGPTAMISVPVSDNQMFIGDQSINLTGTAIDVEDGIVPGTQMHWMSDLSGDLGTGGSLVISASTLAEGTHTITLSAIDGSGETGTATRTIQVFRERPTIPMALNASPAAIEFASNFGTTLTEAQSISIRNAGDGDLQWTAVASDPWIHVDATAGSAPYALAVTVDPTGLSIGTHSGTVIVSSNAATAPITINVAEEIGSIPIRITGRVLTDDNRGIRNATVIMTDSNNVSHRVLTNSFGQFTFLEVPSGVAFRINVSAKRYQFESRIFQPASDLDIGEFVGEQ